MDKTAFFKGTAEKENKTKFSFLTFYKPISFCTAVRQQYRNNAVASCRIYRMCLTENSQWLTAKLHPAECRKADSSIIC